MTIVERALELVPSGCRIGLGSGHAAQEFVKALAERIRKEGFRVQGVATSEETASLGRHHNDANCISIGQRMVSLDLAKKMVDIFLTTPFDGGRHAKRIAEIDR